MQYLLTQRKALRVAALCVGASICLSALWQMAGSNSESDDSAGTGPQASQEIDKALISERLGGAVKTNTYPSFVELDVDGEKTFANIEYALDPEPHKRMQRMFEAYKPDYGAFVAMDARTGRILSLISYSRERVNLDNLAIQASFPAASIFKVVTASAALDLNKANPDTVVPFNGAYHTLYKKNVEETRQNRWTRRMTLREAFARSVNVFFGKLGLFYVGPRDLIEYAERFRFNQPIHADIPVQTGYARISPDDPWSVVTAASGFTQDNTMSPVQGAMIAAAIANDGIMMEPYLVEGLTAPTGASLYRVEPRQASIIVEPKSAEGLRILMQETIRAGTSRKSFRKVAARRDLFSGVELGGKTGSLTGGNPQGKCDWFIGYVRYRDTRVAVAALTVNEEKWRVKSSYLAGSFFKDFIRDIKSTEQDTAKLETPERRPFN